MWEENILENSGMPPFPPDNIESSYNSRGGFRNLILQTRSMFRTPRIVPISEVLLLEITNTCPESTEWDEVQHCPKGC